MKEEKIFPWCLVVLGLVMLFFPEHFIEATPIQSTGIIYLILGYILFIVKQIKDKLN